MVRPLVEYLEGNRIYICKSCQIHLSSEDLRISKAFTGGSGRAFLFDGGINYHYGIPEDKDLLTGRHTVQDLICNGCNTVIGWKYVTSPFNMLIHAQNDSQKYKEGKIILERAYLDKIKWK